MFTVLPPDVFLVQAHQRGLPLSEALSTTAQEALLRQTFLAGTSEHLDSAVSTLLYCSRRQEGLYGDSKEQTDYPAFILENPLMSGETVEFKFIG